MEIDRPSGAARRNGAKSDELDAIRAAREALSRDHLAPPRLRDSREAMRVLLTTREGAMVSRTRAICHLKSLVVNSHQALRDQLRRLATDALDTKCARSRTSPSQSAEYRATIMALRATARRILTLEAEANDHETELEALVRQEAPELLAQRGLSTPYLAGPPLRQLKAVLEHQDRIPPARRAQKFPLAISLRASIWSSLSATMRLSGVFSFGQLLEALGVVGLEAAVLVAPPVIGLVGDLEVLSDLGDVFAFDQEPIGLLNLRTTWSGVCLRFFTAMILLPPLPGHQESHLRWSDFRGSAMPARSWGRALTSRSLWRTRAGVQSWSPSLSRPLPRRDLEPLFGPPPEAPRSRAVSSPTLRSASLSLRSSGVQRLGLQAFYAAGQELVAPCLEAVGLDGQLTTQLVEALTPEQANDRVALLCAPTTALPSRAWMSPLTSQSPFRTSLLSGVQMESGAVEEQYIKNGQASPAARPPLAWFSPDLGLSIPCLWQADWRGVTPASVSECPGCLNRKCIRSLVLRSLVRRFDWAGHWFESQDDVKFAQGTS